MKKKFKLLVSIAGFVISLAVLAFGVIAGINVTYVAQGVINYDVEDAYVSIETRVYSTSKKFTSQQELDDIAKSIEYSGFDKLNSQTTLDSKYDFKKVQLFNTSTPSDYSVKPQDYVHTYTNRDNDLPPQDLTLNLNYQSKSDARTMGYFVVIKITNESSFKIYTKVKTEGESGDDNIYQAPENNYTYKTSKIEIIDAAQVGKDYPCSYICFAMGLEDSGWEMDDVTFNYPIEVKQDGSGIFSQPYVANTESTYQSEVEVSKTINSVGATLTNVPAMIYSGVRGYSIINLNFPASTQSIDITLAMSISMAGMTENITELITDISAVFAKCLNIEECLANQDKMVSDVAVMSDDETYMTANIPSIYLSGANTTDITIIVSYPVEFVEELHAAQLTGFDFTLTSSKDGVIASVATTVSDWGMVEFAKMGESFTTPIQAEEIELTSGSQTFSFVSSIRNYQLRNIPSGTEAVNITFETSEKVQVIFAVQGQKEVFSILDVMLLMEGEIDTLSGVVNGSAVINMPVTASENHTMDFYICMFYNQTAVSDEELIPLSLKVEFAQLDTAITPLDLVIDFDDNYNLYYVVNGIRDTSATDIVVPAYYKNIVIKELDSSAFMGNTTIRNVTFEANSQIDNLWSSMFSGCHNLQSVTFGANSKITVIGSSTFQGCSALKTIVFPDSLTAINSYAFQNCNNLQSLEIPEGVVTLGNNIFSGCSRLESVIFATTAQITSFPDYLFQGCSALKTVVIPNSITSIGSSAFNGCTSLTAITIPENVSYISSNAFNNCKALQQINWNAKYISSSINSSSNIFYNAGVNSATGTCVVTFGANVQTVPNYLFYVSSSSYCPKITQVDFTSQSGTSVNSYVFQNCTALKTVNISKGVTSIGSYAFSGCSNLETVTFDSNTTITSLQSYVFYNCSSLKSFTIPNSITAINTCAFSGCSSLTQIIIPQNVKTIGTSAFQNCTKLERIDWNATSITTNISSSYAIFANAGSSSTNGCIVNIGSNVQTIPNYLFYSSSTSSHPRITQVNISQGVKTIGTYVFYNNANLVTVNIANSVTSIGQYAFYGCSSIVQIVIPDSVATISGYAFKNTSSSTLFDFRTATDIPTLSGTGAFDGVGPNAIIYVPSSLYNNWITATNWQYYFGLIYADNVTAYDGAGIYNYETGRVIQPWDNLITNGTLTVTNGELTVSNESNLTSLSTKLEFILDTSVTKISNAIFKNKAYLASILIPSSVTTIGDEAFYQCSSLEKVIIDDAVCSIGQKAFADCSSMKELDVGDNITEFGVQSLSMCRGQSAIASEIYIGATTVVQERAFSGLGTEALVVDSANTLYYSEDGVLYNKEKTTLIQYPCYKQGSASMLESITGFGPAAFAYAVKVTGEIIIPSQVTEIGDIFVGCSMSSLVIPDGVTVFSTNCFSECSNLETFNMPSNLVTINESAFEGCTSLKMPIILPNSVTTIGQNAFKDCKGITNVVIGNGVSSLGTKVFYGCTNLQSVTLGSGVLSIGTETFRGCTSLTSVIWNNSLQTIGQNAFRSAPLSGKLTLPSTVTTIGSYCFYECKSLTGIDLGSSLLTINSYAFYGCNGINSAIVIPNTTTTIGDYAFQNCSNATSLTIGSSIHTIGQYAFRGCSLLSGNLTIPSNVTTFGQYAFYGCSRLSSLTVGSDGKSLAIPSYAFYGCSGLLSITLTGGITSIGDSAFYNCSNATGTLTIPNNVTTISQNAFYGCSGFTSIVLGSSVQSIGASAFLECSNLSGNLTLPNSLKTIGQSAFKNLTKLTGTLTIPSSMSTISASVFYGCTGFSSLVLSNSITTVNDSAFYGCTGLTSVSLGTNLQTIGQSAFRNCSNITGTVTLSAVRTIGNNAFDTVSKASIFVIGSYITTINSSAFANCSGAVKFDFSACSNIPALVNSNAFNNINSTYKIVVPYLAVENWKSVTNWSNLANYITHPYYDWTLVSKTDATCTTTGTVVYSKGGETVQITLPIIPHNFVDGVCSKCGLAITVKEVATGYTYGFINNNGTYTSNNKGIDNSSAVAEMAIGSSCTLTINWTVSSESGWDKFYIYKNGIVQSNVNGVSGVSSGTLTLTLIAGDVILFKYQKDSSASSNSDCATFTYTVS